MTVIVLVGLGVFGLGCAALWHPRVEAWVHRWPWWVEFGVLAGLLALLALLATRVVAAQSIDIGRTASVLAVVIAVTGGGPITLAVLRGAEGTGVPVSETATTDEPFTPEPTAGEVLRGGAWIGVLERAAIASSLLVGIPEGVAITVAIKGLARYPELRVVGASERFIIGTFASALWAAAAAGIADLVMY